ncbi:hypothetical protein [Scrofimicrobium sp. R131]|uniref:Uncharacterized protein n=1 Tax=Scrofimicrobium appendicitidis TaxID=3079930 RepID=A0AAU7V8F8_9ACTO
MAPRIVGRRQALVLSRDGDRFSTELRLLEEPPALNPTTRGRRPAPMPLLKNASSPSESGTAMSYESSASRPHRPRSATTLRMTTEQTRQLAALKAQRAARISREAAAAQRRLVTVGVAAALMLLTVFLGATGVASWWWTAGTGALLVGSVGGSRLAAINIERAREREDQQFQALQEQVDARGGTRVAPVASETVSGASAAVVSGQAGSEQAVEAAEPVVVEVEMAEVTEVTEVVEVEEAAPVASAIELTESVAAEVATGWTVPQLPVPVAVRKAKTVRRQVHIDTDLRGVPQVESKVGRPMAATASPVVNLRPMVEEDDFNLDLEAVLEKRRAQ